MHKSMLSSRTDVKQKQIRRPNQVPTSSMAVCNKLESHSAQIEQLNKHMHDVLSANYLKVSAHKHHINQKDAVIGRCRSDIENLQKALDEERLKVAQLKASGLQG